MTIFHRNFRALGTGGLLVALAACSKAKDQAPAPSVKAEATTAAPATTPPPAPPTPGARGAAAPMSAERLLVPGKQVGRITAATDRRTLDTLFPRTDATHGTCEAGEEEETPCSHVAVAGREALRVLWNETIKADRVEVLSDTFQTAEGVTVGLTVPELVAKNGGRPIAIAGFASDVPGAVRIPDGPLAAAGLSITLSLPATASREDLETLAVGDEVLSSDARVAKLELRVSKLEIALAGAPASAGAGGCDLTGRYQLSLAWSKKTCSLGPDSLPKLGFLVTKGADGYAVTLDEGVMHPSSSPYYDEIAVEQASGCKLTVKLTQPPSHRTWASLTLEIDLRGKPGLAEAIAGTAAYSESVEGETCETKATVTGSSEDDDQP